MVAEELGWGAGNRGWPSRCWSGHQAFSVPVKLAVSSFCKHRVKAWTCCLTGSQAINFLALTSLGTRGPCLFRVRYVCLTGLDRASGLPFSPHVVRGWAQGLGVAGLEGRENENCCVSKGGLSTSTPL